MRFRIGKTKVEGSDGFMMLRLSFSTFQALPLYFNPPKIPTKLRGVIYLN